MPGGVRINHGVLQRGTVTGRCRRVTADVTVLTLLAFTIAPAAHAASVRDEVVAAICGVVEAGRHPSLRWQPFPRLQGEMQRLYEPGACAPIWLDGGRARPEATDVLTALAEGASCGLDPEDYDATWLAGELARLGAGELTSGSELGLLDTAISLSLMRQIAHRHLGRVNPKDLGVDLDLQHQLVDLAALVRQAVEGNQVRELVESADPRFLQYALLRHGLACYRELARDESLKPVPVEKKVSPGDAYAGVNELRHILAALGDLPASSTPAEPVADVYRGELVEGVKHFQRRHGLFVDGILGSATFIALNTPMSVRVRQIELALERVRWLPDIERGPLVMVNIPAYRLWGWGLDTSDQVPELGMNVVVGKSLGHQTPLFTKEMDYLVFYPSWNVPYSITRKEIIPKLKQEPAYLDEQGMELVRDFAQDAPSATAVTEEVLAELQHGSLKVRQRPGPANSLGLVKFVFPNDHDIYMHDTPAKSLFGRARRDLSHGCIRLQDPVALAQLVLAGNGDWSKERIQKAMQGPQQRVDLKVPVPVFIIYTTAYAEPDGDVHFLSDIYGHDQTLEDALGQGEQQAQ